MIKIENNQVYSSEGKYLHRIGFDGYFKRGTLLPNDTSSDFEEVAEIPPYSEAEYDKKVAELVREKYSESEEFAIQRKAINAAFSSSASRESLAEYAAYNTFVEECKQKAKLILSENDKTNID